MSRAEAEWDADHHRELRANLAEVEATMRPSPPAPPPRALKPVGRLLTDEEAAAYLGVSKSYVRALVANRELRRVELPSADGSGRRARVLRIDVRDLDALVEKLKT